MGRIICTRPLLTLRLRGALLGLGALALGVEMVCGVALVVTDLRTIPVSSLALIPPSDRPGLALLLALGAAVGLALAYGTVRLALLSRALLVVPTPYRHALHARRTPEEAPMRRVVRPVVALAALVLLALSLCTTTADARAASAPTSTPTATPAPTVTPYPTYTPAPAPTATHHPALQLSASQGMPATPLTIVGADFPDGAVTLYWDGAYLARGTSGDAYMHIDTTAPATGSGAALGPHELRAVGPNRTSASAFFTIAQTLHPKVTLAPTHSAAMTSTVVTVDASGFAPNQTVAFAWDHVGGTRIFSHGSVADDNGDTSIDLILGLDPMPGVGTHRLYAWGTGPALSASASFTVDPPPPPPPACGGLGFTVPFINWNVCLDPIGALTTWIAHGATAGANAVGALVAKDLTTQQDYTQIAQLHLAFTTMQQLARDLFGVLFLAGALTWYARHLGLGPGGEAATQLVEGGLGLAVTTALPWLMHLYIVAVNAASGMILADPNNQGGAAIGALAGHLVNVALLSALTGDPLFLVVVVGFIVVFFVLLVLVAITRTIGTIYGAAVYLAAPVATICMVTPLTRAVAAAWARLWLSLTLWGVSYAVALVSVRAMVAAFGGDGLQSLALALAGAFVLYGAPRLGDALLGGGASRALGIGNVPLLGTAARMGLAAATGGAGGAAVAAGGEQTGAAIPSDPSVTPMPTASVSEVASIAPPINAEWGLIE